MIGLAEVVGGVVIVGICVSLFLLINVPNVALKVGKVGGTSSVVPLFICNYTISYKNKNNFLLNKSSITYNFTCPKM